MTENSQETNSVYQSVLNQVEQDTRLSKVRRLEDESDNDPSSDPHVQISRTKALANNPVIRRFLQNTADIKLPAEIAETFFEDPQKNNK